MKVSFVIAAYNVEEYLAQCIESVSNQMIEDFEIIIIDDGSKDGTRKIAEGYASKNNHIHVIHQENEGVSVARNRGINLAKGIWISFIDGDDYIDVDLCRQMECYMDSTYDILFYQYTTCIGHNTREENNTQGQVLELSKEQILLLRMGLLNSDMAEMKEYKEQGYNYHSPWGKFYRRDFLKKYNLRFVKDVKKGQDLLFNFYAYEQAQKIKMIPVIGYYYRIRQTSVGHKFNRDIFEINIKLINEIKQKMVCESFSEDTLLFKSYYLMVVRQFIFAIFLDVCHKDNLENYKKRKLIFEKYRNNPIFEEGFRKADLKQFRFQVYCFSIFTKYKCFLFIDIATKVKDIIEIMKNRG